MSETTIIEGTKQRYERTIASLQEGHGIKNRLAAPRITKVCLNMGVGRAVADGQILNIVSEHLTQLSGQKATITLAKNAAANAINFHHPDVDSGVGTFARFWRYASENGINECTKDEGLPVTGCRTASKTLSSSCSNTGGCKETPCQTPKTRVNFTVAPAFATITQMRNEPDCCLFTTQNSGSRDIAVSKKAKRYASHLGVADLKIRLQDFAVDQIPSPSPEK